MPSVCLCNVDKFVQLSDLLIYRYYGQYLLKIVAMPGKTAEAFSIKQECYLPRLFNQSSKSESFCQAGTSGSGVGLGYALVKAMRLRCSSARA